MRSIVRAALLVSCALLVGAGFSALVTVTRSAPSDTKVKVNRSLSVYSCPPGCTDIQTDVSGVMHTWSRPGFDEYLTLERARDELGFAIRPECDSRGCFKHSESAWGAIVRFCDEHLLDVESKYRLDVVWVRGEWFRNLHANPSGER